MNIEEFDRLSLPKDSSNENLETLSRRKLSEIFPPELFELRDESQRDKGVDLFIELKRKGSFTNFRFAVQLKSTQDSVYNNDGSVSFALDVSNINYLMNHNMPSYYILYKAGQNLFLYVSAYVVYDSLQRKYAGQNPPKTFTYRFSQVLNPHSVSHLYGETFEKGRLFRSINPLLHMSLLQNQPAGNVVINERQEVYTTTERVKYLEKYGFALLNSAKFNEIIELEQQSYPLTNATGIFHFVVGAAYYHKANMYKAIDHFKKATKMIEHLHPEMGVMLGYHSTLAKFALGILSRDEADVIIAQYRDSAYIGLYLRINEAYINYVSSTEEDSVRYVQFYDTLKQIKSSPACDTNLQLLADAQAMQVEGQRLNNELMVELMLNREIPFGERFDDTDAYNRLVDTYNGKMRALRDRALLQNNHLNYLIIGLNSIKINYSSISMGYCIENFDEKTLRSDYVLKADARQYLEEQIVFLEDAAEFYYNLGFLENMVVALSLKYEILHFIGDSVVAAAVKERVLSILETNDLVEYQRKFELLITGGTVHELTLNVVVKNYEKLKAEKPIGEQLQKEMEAFDDEEKRKEIKPFTNQMSIEIFPLGSFAFPPEELEDVINILHIDSSLKEQLKNMLRDGIMPRVNALFDPIPIEGYERGRREQRGIEGYRNLHRIRKCFFEKGYYRLR